MPHEIVGKWEEKKVGKEKVFVQNHCELGTEWMHFDEANEEFVCRCCAIKYAKMEGEAVVYHVRSFGHILKVLVRFIGILV